jgi:nucleoside-diphosphate-sugar epimerase
MNVLVTGASGFTGTEMLRVLAAQDDLLITALARSPRAQPADSDKVAWIVVDLNDAPAVTGILAEIVPDIVIHLAGLNRGAIGDLWRTNAIGTRNLIDAAVQANPACRIVVVSSSAVYGYAGEAPIAEDCPFAPLGMYGISKAAEEHIAMMYYHTRGVQVCIVRPFNLVGPGLSTALVCGQIVGQVHAAKKTGGHTIALAETASRRDFVDVRDVVRGIRALAFHHDFSRECAGKAFNIGSGRAVSIAEVMDLIADICGKKFNVQLPAEPVTVTIPSQRSDNSLIHEMTGWEPEISLAESLKEMYNAARNR